MHRQKKTHRTASQPKGSASHTQLERCYAVAKKMLRHFDLDPELLDAFTKKQRLAILVTSDLPNIKAKKENSIPRHFVKKIREEIFHYMKTNFAGDPENKLTYMDMAICGTSFYISLYFHLKKGTFAGTPQEEIARRICNVFGKGEFLRDVFFELLARVRYLTRSYSQVNFRLYGFNYDWEMTNAKSYNPITTARMKLELTMQNCESKMFTFNGVARKAFRLILTANGQYEPTWAIIRRHKIFPGANKEKYFNIFIQSHVLHRFKERMDSFTPTARNFLIQYALTSGQEVVTTEKHTFLPCFIKNDIPIGYFTFFIQGDDLVVNTFLPLAGEITPEGKKLHTLLPLGKEDMVHLGMDKVSFYSEIDFEQIPTLKQALTASGIWPTKLTLDGMIDPDSLEEGESPINERKTRYVKEFIDKFEQHRRQIERDATVAVPHPGNAGVEINL